MKKLFYSLKAKIQSKRKPNEQSDKPVPARQAPHQEGLKVVHEGNNPSVDLVAVHGQGGNWKTSWTDPNMGTFWLLELLPVVVPETRILSFGYGASKSSITAAEELLAELVTLRKDTRTDQRPIVFLEHSFGGILLKGALAISNGKESTSLGANVAASTYGILFFGVPQQIETSLNNLALASAEEQSPINESVEIQALKRDFRWLQKSNPEYSQICQLFVTRYFVETVDDDSSKMQKDEEGSLNLSSTKVVSMSKTHGQMTRFPDADDEDFQKMSKVLASIVAEAKVECIRDLE